MEFSKNAGHLSHFAGRGTSDENAAPDCPSECGTVDTYALRKVRMVTGIAVAPPMWVDAHLCWHYRPPMLNTAKHGGAVAMWVKALDWRPGGPRFESRCENYPGLSIYREIRVFPRAVGNTGNYREILGITGKYREIGKRWPMGTSLWVANIMAWCLNQS